MPIVPLPQFEADLAADAEAYARLSAPKSIVVRFGSMRMVGEFPYDGDAKPGCGSKLVARTHRGTELCEMLTTTCPNSGCGKSVSRKELLGYIENSGGKDFPFHTDGRILRVATAEDMNRQAALEAQAEGWLRTARRLAIEVGLTSIKVVSAEPILGGERLTFHFLSEERVDFRPLVMELAKVLHTRIEMHQVGARDEARITADYERCGQHCCCRQFLKVLKPVSMKAAKTQKATLDPLKISGRCGRLMCCLRYEESTYDELKKNLPRKKSAVLTPDGPGVVIDSQILTQLVLVRLDATNEDAAYPVETLKPALGPGGPGAGGPGAGGPVADDDQDGPPDGGPAEGGGGGPTGGGDGPAGGGRPRGDDGRSAGGRGGHRGGGEQRGGPGRGDAPRGSGDQRDRGGGGGPAGAPRQPLSEQERARRRVEKLVPPSAFRPARAPDGPAAAGDGPAGEQGAGPGA